MGPGGFRRLQNDCDLTTSGLVGSIPMHSRHQGPDRVRRPLTSGCTRTVPRSRHAVARRFRTDSLVVIGYEPAGTPITQVSAFNDKLINVRRGHMEDWIAFLIANHLFAAADAYVAAHLWDLPTQISVESRPGGAVLA